MIKIKTFITTSAMKRYELHNINCDHWHLKKLLYVMICNELKSHAVRIVGFDNILWIFAILYAFQPLHSNQCSFCQRREKRRNDATVREIQTYRESIQMSQVGSFCI